jgi:hypothetical protein
VKRGKQKKREERPAARRFMVVDRIDCRRPKYLAGEVAVGFEEQHARTLAEPVNGDDRFGVTPVEVFNWARAQGRPITLLAAEIEYQAAAE